MIRRFRYALAVALALAFLFAGAMPVLAALPVLAPPQLVTTSTPPAWLPYYEQQGLVLTNAVDESCAGQLITTGHLDAKYACWLAGGLLAAYGGK